MKPEDIEREIDEMLAKAERADETDEEDDDDMEEILRLSAEKVRQKTSERLSRVDIMKREREIRDAIANHSDLGPLDPERIVNMRKSQGNGRLLLAEYIHRDTLAQFVYIDKTCKDPSFLGPGRVPMAFPNPGRTILMRVIAESVLKELYEWWD